MNPNTKAWINEPMKKRRGRPYKNPNLLPQPVVDWIRKMQQEIKDLQAARAKWLGLAKGASAAIADLMRVYASQVRQTHPSITDEQIKTDEMEAGRAHIAAITAAEKGN